MANRTEKSPNVIEKYEEEEEEEEEDEEQTFEELGLDPRLVRALIKKGIEKPTPIQRVAIPFILEGKDVVARAKTGSGKTQPYLLPLLQKLFSDSGLKNKLAPAAFVLVPTRELCQQVYSRVSSLIELCRVQLKVVQLSSSMTPSDLRAALAGPPDILVSTPACIPKCLSAGILKTTAINDSLDILVLDEADLLLSYGADVEKLKKLILHNPYILTLPEVGDIKDEIVPKNVQQFSISCSARDKLLYILVLLKLELVQKKVLIFTNTIDMGFRLKLFLEKFGIRSAVLNAELPQNSRLHILEEFNAGLFDYLIATDDSQTEQKEQAEPKKSRKHAKQKLDSEFGVVRGIDFKNVHTVMNFEMPQNAAGYVLELDVLEEHIIWVLLFLCYIVLSSSNEMEIFEEIKSFLGDNENKDTNFIAPFPLLTKNAVESLRYRAEDVAKSVTKIAVRESRAQDLRNEILNSEKLKAHFEVNPRDLDLLKHDKVLSKKPPPPHLRDVPDYLLDPTTKEASKIVKLARAAMGNTNSARCQGSQRKFRKSRDPLKSFSAEAPKKALGGGMKRKGNDKDDNHNHFLGCRSLKPEVSS
ncbi:hypothetical protein L1049_016932 [Liquidambar formosana]|uniref:RNA helicase n=1 Tax=Liquidambar formosana TaxID=63359 RepID=A0AAP0X7V2_LIQFO